MLDVRTEFNNIRQMYKDSPGRDKFNCLLIGRMGTGKTTTACTGRKPVLLHAFDPGGEKAVADLIQSGEVIADSRFSYEDPKKPTQFEAWVAEMQRLERIGIFQHIGTYVLDSLTTWSDCLIGSVMKRTGHLQSGMEIQDWGKFLNDALAYVRTILALPCDVVVTAHLDFDKDEGTGQLIGTMMMSGQGKIKIPLLFDERYIMQAKETATGVAHSLLTKSTGKLEATTRMGRNGKFALVEEPNLKALLQKAGKPSDDLPLFNEGGKEVNV